MASGSSNASDGGFHSLGAVKLKKAKRTSDGRLIETVESASLAKAGAGGGEGGQNELLGMLDTDLLSQTEEVALAAGEGFTTSRQLTAGRVEEGTRLFGAPPLAGNAPFLEVVPAAKSGGSGLLSTILYAFRAPRVAAQQRAALQVMGTELAKYKKKSAELQAALGRAARLAGLTPPECEMLVEACQDQELTGLEQRLRAEEVKEAKQTAEQEYERSRAEAEERLATLRQQEARIVTQLESLQASLAEQKGNLETLAEQERALRREADRGIGGGDASARVVKYEEVKAKRKVVEVELQTLQDRIRAAQRPLARIRKEMEEVIRGIDAVRDKREEAERRARAFEVSGDRREEYTNRTVAEMDEEIGRIIQRQGVEAPELRQLLLSNDACIRLAAQWERLVSEQQAELDAFDEKRARNGFWILVGGLLGFLFLLLLVAEVLRRFFVETD